MAESNQSVAVRAAIAVVVGYLLLSLNPQSTAATWSNGVDESAPLAASNDSTPTFQDHILPILAQNCFSCHGPDESHREADLRLDLRDSALQVLNPEDPEQGEFLRRISSTDPEVVMPPPSPQHQPLSREQIAVLKTWILDGAEYTRHWSLEIPVRPQVPVVDAGTRDIPRTGTNPLETNENRANPIDAFVLDRLKKEGLSLSEPASPITLMRRVSFDLTGLPPDHNDIRELLADSSSEAYHRYVDRLLASPHFGERMAMWWLDAARYSDTDGFQQDATRTNWPWRDWVIDSFNQNMPFSDFTIQQFAGDLLPNATDLNRLATAFHRNHMTNGEGGRDPEESRVEYVIDRTNSVGTVWLGLTLGCCQCHSHKYDPISHSDYYSLSAFFNSIDESGKAGRDATPFLKIASPYVTEQVAEAELWLKRRAAEEQSTVKAAEPRFTAWLQRLCDSAKTSPGSNQTWLTPAIVELQSTEGTALLTNDEGIIQSDGPNPNQDDYRVTLRSSQSRITGFRLEVFPHPSHTRGRFSRGSAGHFVLTDIKVQIQKAGTALLHDVLIDNATADASDDPKKYEGYGDIRHVLDDDPRNGWSIRDADQSVPHRAVFAFAEPVLTASDEVVVVELRMRSTLGDANIGRFRISFSDQAGPAIRTPGSSPVDQLQSLISAGKTIDDIPSELRELLRTQFLADDRDYQIARRKLELATRQRDEFKAAENVDVMVLAERAEPRATHVLVRGVWDKPGELVERSVPAAIGGWGDPEKPSRLQLAEWIVSKENPLTARVVVNHLWQMMFGHGIVRTVDDFGVQGERPTHPELLDWLAVEFIESGWNVKHLLKLMVTSRTYQQSSVMTEELRDRDPENRLLARSFRHRLPSWMLRDAALKASGLLNSKVGGPPVRPWQPEGVWEEMFMGRFRYEPSQGSAQYRRSLYAFWRRAVAPTFMFDSAQRRVCEVRINRTNTPLHALTLLNDTTYLEASRGLAEAVLAQQLQADPVPTDPIRDRIQLIAQAVLSRNLNESEVRQMMKVWQDAADWFRSHPDDGRTFLSTANPNDHFALADSYNETDCEHLAAFTVVASAILNLDEAMTHE